jgi:ribonuclease T2
MRKAQQYVVTLRVVRILAFIAGWIALSHGSLADVAMNGSFLASADCPAFQSFRKGTNPGGVKIEVGHSYQLLAKNAPNASHYRIRIDGATPPERWVSLSCGSVKENTNIGAQGSEAAADTTSEKQTQFVLSLGWEPGFCESHDKKSECASETSDR